MKKKKKKVYNKGIVNPITGLIDFPESDPIAVFEETVILSTKDITDISNELH